MLNLLSELYAKLDLATRANPILAGAVSLWGLGVLTFVCRGVPSRLWNYLVTQSTTRLELNNAGWYNETLFHGFLEWYDRRTSRRWSRSFSVRLNHENHTILGTGYGFHLLWVEHRLGWFSHQKLESQGSEKQKETIVVSLLTRDQRKIRNLVAQFQPPVKEDKLKVFSWSKSEWHLATELVHRPLESVVLEAQTKDAIVQQLDDFYEKREWYLRRGLNYKLSLLLHGEPGCGKTSLIKALASRYKRDIYTVNVNSISDESLQLLVALVPAGSFLLLEDIDSIRTIHDRTARPTEVTTTFEDLMGLSLTGVLNTLDGVVSLDGVVVFMTTNHKDRLDAALLRKGRTDFMYELRPLQAPEVQEYVRYVYGDHPDFVDSDLSDLRASVAGCDLQGLLLEHKEDYRSFLVQLRSGVTPSVVPRKSLTLAVSNLSIPTNSEPSPSP